MTGSRARRVKDAFDRALDATPEERERLLATECGPETRREVEMLLETHGRSDGFLDRPAADRLRAPLAPGTRVGRYIIVRTLAAGGGGTVYEAEQEDPHRRVAVKVMTSGFFSGASEERFREEAGILARLRHPWIATVYDAGVHDGMPYFALEYVEGARPVTEHARGLELRARLELFAKVCDAVHHGHQHGYVHRDLKPDNILVDGRGEPRVIDFGIARAVGARGAREISGTLPYMSPEQCDPAAPSADARVDVYALGVLLHEVLTGSLPFDVAGLPTAEALRRIRDRRPASPSAHDRGFRGDLDAIVAKATAHAPAGRYASVAALAEDVRRHLSCRPVEARPATFLYVATRFARRRRGAFLAIVSVAASLLIATVVSGAFAVHEARAQRAAEYEAYLANISAVPSALQADGAAEARRRLDEAPERLRGWEWRHLLGRLDRSARTLSPTDPGLYRGTVAGGRIAAVFHSPPALRLWDAGTGGTVASLRLPDFVRSITLATAKPLLALALWDGTVEIRNSGDGALLRSFRAHETYVNALAFGRDARRLLTGSEDTTIRVWDVESGALERTLTGHEDRVLALAFTGDGGLLASGSRDGMILLRETGGWEVVRTIRTSNTVECLSFDPSGRRLAWGSRDQIVRLWDLGEGCEVAAMAGHRGNVREVRFSPDGSTLASAGEDGTVRLWESAHGRAAGVLRGHAQPVYSVGFLPSGEIVSFGFHGEAKVWAADAGDEVLTLRGHKDAVQHLAFCGPSTLASLSYDGDLRLWDLKARRELGRAVRRRERSQLQALAASGGRLLAAHGDGDLCEYAPSDLAPRGTTHMGQVRIAAAGTHLVVLRRTKGGWTAPDTARVLAGGRDLTALAVDPVDGKVALGLVDGGVTLLSRGTLAEIATRTISTDRVRAVAFAPDGRTLAASAMDGETVILDVPSLALRAPLPGHALPVAALCYSPDGSRLATGGPDGIRLWDPVSARLVLLLATPDDPVLSLAWSPDGRRLASGHGRSLDAPSRIRIWEAGSD